MRLFTIRLQTVIGKIVEIYPRLSLCSRDGSDIQTCPSVPQYAEIKLI